MSAALELTGTHVKYLLVIYEIGQAGQSVSSADVAKRLEVSRPSVTRMLNVLTEKGLTEKARYGKIALTPAGERVAERCVCQIERMARLLPQTGLRLSPSELLRPAAAMAGALPARCFLD